MAGAALATAAPASAEPAVGVIASAGNALVSFDTTKPGAYTSVRPITGLAPNEKIVGLDFRYFPIGNGAKALYAVGVVDGGARVHGRPGHRSGHPGRHDAGDADRR